MAVRAVVFSSVATAGQRCTSTRRVILHNKIKDEFLGKVLYFSSINCNYSKHLIKRLCVNLIEKLKTGYKSILERVGDPLDDNVLYGPLHNQQTLDKYKVQVLC